MDTPESIQRNRQRHIYVRGRIIFFWRCAFNYANSFRGTATQEPNWHKIVHFLIHLSLALNVTPRLVSTKVYRRPLVTNDINRWLDIISFGRVPAPHLLLIHGLEPYYEFLREWQLNRWEPNHMVWRRTPGFTYPQSVWNRWNLINMNEFISVYYTDGMGSALDPVLITDDDEAGTSTDTAIPISDTDDDDDEVEIVEERTRALYID